MAAHPLSARRVEARTVLQVLCLTAILAAEGLAVAHSYMWAAPLAALLVAAVAIDIPLVPLLTVTLLVRVLTDATLSSTTVRHTGAVNLSAGIAVLFLLIAIGLVLRRQRGAGATALALLWLAVWTTVAVGDNGATAVTIREGVREASIFALALIVANSRGALTMPVVTRVIQVVGCVSAVVALYQLATHTGVTINGQVRSAGTFTHPNGASMYFAVAATASVWRFFDLGRRRLDLLFALLFGAAAISTFSLSGLGALLAMLVAFGLLRRGSLRLKLGSFAIAALLVVGFLATPLGAERISEESSTNLGAAQSHETRDTSLGWRFHKWELLLEEWSEAPFFGQGLGTSTTKEAKTEDVTAGSVPHNEYLRYLVETGALGLLTVGAAVIALLRALKRRRFGPQAGAAILGTAVAVGCLANGLADNTFLYSTTGYAVALVLGAALSLPGRESRRAPSPAIVPGRLAADPAG